MTIRLSCSPPPSVSIDVTFFSLIVYSVPLDAIKILASVRIFISMYSTRRFIFHCDSHRHESRASPFCDSFWSVRNIAAHRIQSFLLSPLFYVLLLLLPIIFLILAIASFCPVTLWLTYKAINYVSYSDYIYYCNLNCFIFIFCHWKQDNKRRQLAASCRYIVDHVMLKCMTPFVSSI